MDWWDYVRGLAPEMSQKAIADVAGVDQSAVSRWKKGDTPSADSVIRVARAFDRPPVEALYVAGLLKKAELGDVVEIVKGASDLSNEDLVRAISDRLGVQMERRRGA